MSCDHAAGIMAAFIGTAAGLPLAGIIAAIALSKVSRRIQDRLQRLGLVPRIPTVDAKAALDPQSLLEWAEHADVSNFGIVDDDVYVNLGPACDVISSARMMAKVVFEEYAKAGLSLHLKPTQTATVVTWRGKGKAEAAAEAAKLQAEDGGFGFKVFGCDKRIPIAYRYKHVGSISRADLKACSDVTAKMGRSGDLQRS